MTLTLRPRRIEDDRIAVQNVETETLLYDERSHKAWCLNRSSACIWRLCDGQNTVSQIAVVATAQLETAVSEEIVLLTLAELSEKKLLPDDYNELLPAGMTRRQMISRAGLTAAALLPVIAALTAPRAHAAGGSVGTGGEAPEDDS
jgi:hypothetical protein